MSASNCRDATTAGRAGSIAIPAAAIAIALGLAAALRFGVIEPADLAHRCGAPDAPGWCALRSLAVAAIAIHALGVAALAAGVVATFGRSSAWALAAACLGAAGLVLASVEAGAVGFLLGALVLARSVAAGRPGPEARREREA